MGATIITNGQTVVHSGSGGSLTTVDVCKTQVGSSVVPIPYANIAKSADTANGSSTVKMDGKSIMLKGSVFSKSKGDDPGKIGGVRSGTTKSTARFLTFSPNVKVEKKNVCRRLDRMNSNKGNTSTSPLMQGNVKGAALSEGHLLTIAFVYKHPEVTTNLTCQAVLQVAYKISGSRTIEKTGDGFYSKIQERCPQGSYSLTFDRSDLKKRLRQRDVVTGKVL